MDFEIKYLDHVAIRVREMEKSVTWYQQVLGLKKYEIPEWGDYPIFMLAGKTGIALFPADSADPAIDPRSKGVKIDHLAFRVSFENFERAKLKYEELNIEYQFQDHTHFHSLYTKDPDGHVVELTAIVVDEREFYG